MAFPTQVSATELLLAFRATCQVLADHETALNQLQAAEEQDFYSADPLASDSSIVATDPSIQDQTTSSSITPRDQGLQNFAGTDLAQTMAAAVLAAEGASDMAHLFEGLRRGSSQAATGQAGHSLDAVFAGLAEVLCNLDHLDGPGFALGLEVAAELLAPRDDGQHPGEMPAVLAATAAGALSALDDGGDLAEVVIAAADEGLAELETGPTLNPGLVDRGVVDAAAAGFLLILDSLASVLTDEPLPSPPVDTPVVLTGGIKYVVRCEVLAHAGCGLESANWLESTWHELGTLTLFNGIGPVWKAALVTTLPGEAVEAVFEVGRPQNLHIGLASESS